MKGSTVIEARSCRYRFGTAEFDSQRLELRVAGAHVEVQRKPLEILAQLLQNAGSIVTRQQLLEAVWGGRPIVDNVLASAVTKLRNALGPENSIHVVTHPRVGYRWRGTVERFDIEGSDATALELRAGVSLPGRDDFVLMLKLQSNKHNEVWTAQHVRTGELRVYKMSRSPEGLSALRRETALLQLLHRDLGERPDIAYALDWNFETAPYFVGYEFAGTNLASWAESGAKLHSIPLRERLEVFLNIALAVAAVHEVGVLHQDLKPTNLLISQHPEAGWRICLTDFGSGRLLQSERLAKFRITQFGLLSVDTLTSCSSSATPIYVAPELLAGQPASKQSDVYALGVLLYQLRVGDLRQPLAPGWERNIEDDLLRDDISRATDFDPSQRFEHVSQLCERLANLGARRAEREQLQDAHRSATAAREAALYRRARRGWMVATLILSVVSIAEAAVLAGDWLAR
ncbi:MAG: winged helix-turn-helix domain-containing protein [Steroidobacter sp.]